MNESTPGKGHATGSVPALINQALALSQQRRLPEAEQALRQALILAPDSFDALHHLGILRFQAGDKDDALRLLALACEQNPRNSLAQHNQGIVLEALARPDDALACYDRAIALDPGFAAALFNRGQVHRKSGRNREALTDFEQAIARKPDFAEAHNNRGNVLQDLGRHQEALASFDEAIRRKPDFALAHLNRGVALRTLGRAQEALAIFDRAVTLMPGLAEAHANRGIVLRDLNRPSEALENLDRAIALKPGFAEAHSYRGRVLRDLHRHGEALESLDRALALKPGLVEARLNLGGAQRDLGRLHEALRTYELALTLMPDLAEAHANRAIVLRDLNRHPEALESLDRALALKPDSAEAHNNRGNVLRDLNRPAEAIVSYEQAIRLRPDFAEAYMNLGIQRLLLGDYAGGWPLYEWRRKTDQFAEWRRTFTQPEWTGEQPIAGKTLLLYAEQGLGDAIQFMRYVPMVESLGASVILEIPAPLVTLSDTLNAKARRIIKGATPPDFDLHCPLMSLPLAFKTRIETLPAEPSYLAVDPRKAEEVRARLGVRSKKRIGLVWSGYAGHRNDRDRSIALRRLEPLLRLDFEFHSLQREVRPDDLATLTEFTQIRPHQHELKDFSDTAALLSELDLMITVDTSVAHLAGALGKATWVMLSTRPDWRWMTERMDSPWYPSLRLFRQKTSGDWDGVIAEILDELQLTTRP